MGGEGMWTNTFQTEDNFWSNYCVFAVASSFRTHECQGHERITNSETRRNGHGLEVNVLAAVDVAWHTPPLCKHQVGAQRV